MDDVEQDAKDLVEKARILSEATGRDLADVIADLADDGILNESNKKQEKNLVAELKEAAELISAVQDINKAASENGVLNGGENKTEVKVETTLEGDIVDRAIASVHRKAVEMKKVILIVAPLFLILGGGSLEALGITDWSGDDDDDDYSSEYGGCTDSYAENYDPDASWDDGSCYWDYNDGGECSSWIQWDSSTWRIEGDRAIVNPYIYDANYCYNTWEGRIHIQIDRDGAFYDDDYFYDVSFTDSWSAEHIFFELPEGQYAIRLNFIEDGGSNWAWDISEEYRIECALDFVLENASAELRPSSSDDIELNIVVHNQGECAGDFEVMVAGYEANQYRFTIEFDESEYYYMEGDTKSFLVQHYKLENLGEGNWSFEVRVRPINGNEDCCIYTNEVEVSRED